MTRIILALPVAALLLCGCNKGEGQAAAEPVKAAEGAAAAPEAEGGGLPGSVTVSGEAQKAGGIRPAAARRPSGEAAFQALGRVLQDAQKTRHISAGGAGTLEAVKARLGGTVKAGEELARVRGADGRELAVTSAWPGLITAVHAAEGDRVDEMTYLFTVTEVDPLWGVLDIHERNLEAVRQGQKVRIRSAAYPKTIFNGTIAFVAPEIDPESRTVKARVAIENPAGLLKFGMFIDAEVLTGGPAQGVAVPAAAVQSGAGGPFVFVRRSPTEFAVRPVTTGAESGGAVEITGGLRAGEQVAAEGAFLLKSELMKAQLGEE